MELAIVPKGRLLPLSAVLLLSRALRRTLFSAKFYREVNDKILTKRLLMDALLYFACYSLLTLSAVLNNKPRIVAFLRLQRAKVHKALGLPPPTEKPVSVAPSRLAVHAKAASLYIADIRIFNRLTSTIEMMPWAIDEFQALFGALGLRADRAVNFLQALNCMVLEVLENAGWLTDHNWVGTKDNAWWSTETYIWCSRVWGFYLLVEIVELFRRVPASKWNTSWKIALFKQVVQVPLVMHWSLYDGCLTPFWVGLCGSGASWWGFRDLFRSLDI